MRPPRSACFPRPGRLKNGELSAIQQDSDHARVPHLHPHRAGRAQHAQRGCVNAYRRPLWMSTCAGKEWSHTESIRAMTVEEFGRTDTILAEQFTKPC